MIFSFFLLGFQHQHLAVLGHKFQLGALCLFQPIFFVLTFYPLSVAFVAKLLGNLTCRQGLETKQKSDPLREISGSTCSGILMPKSYILILREMSPISAWMFHKSIEYSNAPSSHSERNDILKKVQFVISCPMKLCNVSAGTDPHHDAAEDCVCLFSVTSVVSDSL